MASDCFRVAIIRRFDCWVLRPPKEAPSLPATRHCRGRKFPPQTQLSLHSWPPRRTAASAHRRKTYRECLSWLWRGDLFSIRRSTEPGRTDFGACFRFRAAALSNSCFRNPIAKTSDILSKVAIQMP